jgi:cysteine synthase
VSSENTPSGGVVIPGPTYTEMQKPWTVPADIRARAAEALHARELDPINLFNIHWYDLSGEKPRVRHVVLPPALTGVPCNIVVLLGCGFPSGSHKVGPAYSILAEGEVDGEVRPGMRMIGPSTGNFGIGVAYISKLKGYPATVVMPDNMSDERYQRIRKYGGDLELTPGTESDVILVLERVQEIKHRPNQYVLAQFEMMPNYRFHRHVTGTASIECCKGLGDGRIAAFVSAPGSAGTIAAGDAIRQEYQDCAIVAAEPRECSTLYNGGQGTHRIEGIGDKMVVLIHNVLNTDWVVQIHDDDCVKGLEALQAGAAQLQKRFGLDASLTAALAGQFGVSGLCNILGAIKIAKKLDLPKGANVVTIATDGFDRYPSVMEDLAQRTHGPIDDRRRSEWYEQIILGATSDEFLDVRTHAQKDRLHEDKRTMWTRFGYSEDLLDKMGRQSWWEAEYEKTYLYDRKLAKARG